MSEPASEPSTRATSSRAAFASASAVRRRYSHGHSTARAQPASDRPSAAASALPACKLRRCRITCCCPAFRLTHAHQVRSVRFLVRSWFHYFFSVVLCMLGTRVCQSVSFLSVPVILGLRTKCLPPAAPAAPAPHAALVARAALSRRTAHNPRTPRASA